MGCLKLTYHKSTELKVIRSKKELTLKNSVLNERKYLKARYYDPRISIFVNVDPLAEKYPNYTPYHYVHQNPINMIDPTGMAGEDFRLKKEGKHHTVETTIHIYGEMSCKQVAQQIENAYKRMNKNTLVGENGETMSFNISVSHHDTKESALKAVQASPGDNVLEMTEDIYKEPMDLYDNVIYPGGDDKSSFANTNGYAYPGGREGKAKLPNSAIHEIGHFLGLGERYELTEEGLPFSPKPFTNDIMGTNRPREINSVHYKNIYNHISNDKNKYEMKGDTRIYQDIGIINEIDRNK